MVEWRQAYCFLQHMLEVSAVRLHACTKTFAPLVNYCIVHDALVDVIVLSHWPHVWQQVCVARSSSEQMTSLARKCVGNLLLNLCGNMWPV